jgi:hypothetical protein
MGRLLAQRSASHSDEVIEPYQRLIEEQVSDGGDKAPLQTCAADALGTGGSQSDGRPERKGHQFLAEFHDRNRRRPTLLKMLEEAGFRA